MAETQNYKNHARWYPFVHFVIVPLLAFNLIWQIVRLVQEPSWDRGENVLMGAVFIMIMVAARLQSMRVQDRLIRLEEHLRYKNLLSPELAVRACQLPTNKIIALRFASDEELAGLIERTLAGEFANNKEIKIAVKNWRGDYLRV